MTQDTEFKVKWWEAPEAIQPRRYLIHLIVDCRIPYAEALALTINNFGLDRPDPLDTLLAKLEN